MFDILFTCMLMWHKRELNICQMLDHFLLQA